MNNCSAGRELKLVRLTTGWDPGGLAVTGTSQVGDSAAMGEHIWQKWGGSQLGFRGPVRLKDVKTAQNFRTYDMSPQWYLRYILK